MTRKNTGVLRYFLLVLALAGLGGLSYLGWNWLDGLTCSRIEIAGFRYAERGELLAVARVDTGVRLLDIDPAMIKDRVERHPWVRRAAVRRIPPGTVSIRVAERVPVALATDERGRPSVYLDAEGFPMPAVPEAVFDVPLVHGVKLPENPTQAVKSPAVVDLLGALSSVDHQTDALMSAFQVGPTGDVTLHTVPAAGRASVPVRLGRGDFAEKFVRLQAFWDQAVVTRPDLAFDFIDLRFDSQIVTRES